MSRYHCKQAHPCTHIYQLLAFKLAPSVSLKTLCHPTDSFFKQVRVTIAMRPIFLNFYLFYIFLNYSNKKAGFSLQILCKIQYFPLSSNTLQNTKKLNFSHSINTLRSTFAISQNLTFYALTHHNLRIHV